MTDNKLIGIVKNLSEKTKGILLQTPEETGGLWFNPIGDKVKEYITSDLKGKEIELSIVDVQKRTFSFLKILKGDNVKSEFGRKKSTEEQRRYRAMSVSYAKDAWIADKITKDLVIDMAQSIFLFIMDGKKD